MSYSNFQVRSYKFGAYGFILDKLNFRCLDRVILWTSHGDISRTRFRPLCSGASSNLRSGPRCRMISPFRIRWKKWKIPTTARVIARRVKARHGAPVMRRWQPLNKLASLYAGFICLSWQVINHQRVTPIKLYRIRFEEVTAMHKIKDNKV